MTEQQYRKCWMCGENYLYEEDDPNDVPKVISKPGAALHITSCPMPRSIQSVITHNLQCPARPGGIDFVTWFKWKVRKFGRWFWGKSTK